MLHVFALLALATAAFSLVAALEVTAETKKKKGRGIFSCVKPQNCDLDSTKALNAEQKPKRSLWSRKTKQKSEDVEEEDKKGDLAPIEDKKKEDDVKKVEASLAKLAEPKKKGGWIGKTIFFISLVILLILGGYVIFVKNGKQNEK
jgi:Flp pilus assembly protein TadB